MILWQICLKASWQRTNTSCFQNVEGCEKKLVLWCMMLLAQHKSLPALPLLPGSRGMLKGHCPQNTGSCGGQAESCCSACRALISGPFFPIQLDLRLSTVLGSEEEEQAGRMQPHRGLAACSPDGLNCTGTRC